MTVWRVTQMTQTFFTGLSQPGPCTSTGVQEPLLGFAEP